MLIDKPKTVSGEAYEQKLASLPKLSSEQKAARLQTILKSPDGMQRLGQGMVGPIQIRLRYEGMARNVLQEDTLERGPLMPYDILDDLGMAYILNSTDAEVKVQVFEGKQAYPQIFRVASFPRIRKEDLVYLRVNAVEYAQDESRQAIQKQEDFRLITLLESAITDFGAAGQTPTGGIATGISAGPASAPAEKTVLIGANNPLEPVDFYSAVSMIEIEQVEANKVLMHPQDVRDLYTWDINLSGWSFKDKVMAGEKVTSMGEFEIQKSVMVPQGEIFLMADSKYVGVMPVMYSLDVEENHLVEQFYKGWVMDEMIGMLILNARGLARIVKADNYADIGTNGVTAGTGTALQRTNIANRGTYQ